MRLFKVVNEHDDDKDLTEVHDICITFLMFLMGYKKITGFNDLDADDFRCFHGCLDWCGKAKRIALSGSCCTVFLCTCNMNGAVYNVNNKVV